MIFNNFIPFMTDSKSNCYVHAFLFLFILLASSCKILPEVVSFPTEDVNFRTTQGIERDLEYLTYSLAMAHHDLYDTLTSGILYNPISNIMFRKASKGVTEYYSVTFDYILNKAESIGIELDTMMNAYIREAYNITDTANLVREILANNSNNNTNYSFHIVFPYLDNLVGLNPDSVTELITMTETKFTMLNSKRPVWTWSYLKKAYPLEGYSVTGIGSWVELGDVSPIGLPKPMAVIGLTPIYTDLYISDDDKIIDCVVEESFCKECPYISTSEPLEYAGGASGSGHSEITIILHDPFESESRNDCFIKSSPIFEFNEYGPYAILRSLEEFQYYISSSGTEYKTLTIIDDPIFSSYSNKWGKYLTICQQETTFKVIGESGGDYSIARGGVYMLSIPSVTNEPIYFSYPFAPAFWYSDGPDYKFRYLLTGLIGAYCYIWPENESVTGKKGLYL